MKPINFAVIGCGMLARQMHLPHLNDLEDARLHTCCDINAENLEAARAFNPSKITRDYRTAVADPEVDALLIATTETFRIPIIEAAARAGKPIYCEKPLADTLANALTIRQLVDRHHIPFCVGHNRRCSPAMQEAREIFVAHMRHPSNVPWRFEREGWEKIPVGENQGAPVVAIRVNDDWKSWKYVHMENDLNRKVGLLLSEGTHFADLATWFIEAPPISVFCAGEGVLNHSIIVRYANGGMATITMAATGSFGYPKELLEAIGHGGIVACDHMLEIRSAGIAGAPPYKTFPMLSDRHPCVGTAGGLHGWLEKKRAACDEATQSNNPLQQFTAEPDKGHRHMLTEFIKEIRREREPVCPVGNALTAMLICLAAAKSHIQGTPVILSEISREPFFSPESIPSTT